VRRVLAPLAALLAVLMLTPPSAEAAPSASDVESAQRRANEAAARLARAQTAQARAEDDVKALEARVAANRQRLSSLEVELRDLAVTQYMQGGDRSVWIGDPDLSQASRGRAMLRFVTLGRTDAIAEYRTVSSDLADSEASLRKRLNAQRSVVERLKAEEAKVSAELEKLAAAQQALEAQQAAQAARQPSQRAAPAPAAPRRGVSAALPRVIGSGEWICPVQGPRAFTNDWGQPRSGGRRHQGTDIMAPRGTPVVANVSGTVRGHNSSLGGISYYLNGNDGNTYFGTHLDSLTGVSGQVSAGTVIGRVGNSGNARGGPTHLHFEIHPGGGGPVNPYPTVARYC
jgi:murein DD-endopeptidase MepM/ murein hydrolase activator NlpD